MPTLFVIELICSFEAYKKILSGHNQYSMENAF